MRVLALALLVLMAAPAAVPLAAQGKPGDYVAHNFRFSTGETLPEVKIHYVTLGTLRRDAGGISRNVVMILHGTGGTGRAFLSRNFGGELFGPGQMLDTSKFFIVLPDNLGHGGSSKPSDGLRMKFPQYTYDDMVALQHRLLTDGLQVNHLRLVMGTSMGCMHAWVWGYAHPTFVDGLVPLACAPTSLVGRNRIIRTMIADNIKSDPEWKNGDYTSPPMLGLKAAIRSLYIMSSAPLVQHRQAPTREAADSLIRAYVEGSSKTTDANNMLYYFDASRTYDPSSHLEAVTAPVLAINSADDFVNPPELHIVEPLIAKVKQAKFILLPITEQTRGHGTHSQPAIWGSYLKEFLATLPER
ncbi:MAG: alpha/beta fold hydrolase [Gemmatimonadetes bacterium]|nr:alpha/beta fold hydrolase [Gemmatimonadota bacterium]